MNDERQETLDDICQKIRDAGIPELADHILAAWKRERAEIEAQALSIGGIVESSRHTQKPQGNAAALREAVVALLDALDSLGCDESTATLAALVPDMADSSARCLAAFRKAKAALSAPARNCDLPLVVDGPADNNADKAWLVFKKHNPDAYFDVSGLLRCIDWLLAPAAELKGECDGR